MEIRRLDRADLQHENGLDAARLLPWPALNAPFEGSWCVVRPGTASVEHAHHEHEIFVAVSGQATVESAGVGTDFAAGDIAYFPPGTSHRVINNTGADFEMYSVWWDLPMSEQFTTRSGAR